MPSPGGLKMKITCEGSKRIPFKDIKAFQGDFKRRTEKDVDKIVRSIKKNGFSFPIFVWNEKCLDGHGRLLALKKLEESGVEIPPIPVVEVQADSIDAAKEKLLQLNARYGQITAASLEYFIKDLDFDLSDVNIVLDKLTLEIPTYQEVSQRLTQEQEEEPPYSPTFAPTISTRQVSDQSVQKTAENLESVMAKREVSAPKKIELFCPNCSESFFMDIDDVRLLINQAIING